MGLTKRLALAGALAFGLFAGASSAEPQPCKSEWGCQNYCECRNRCYWQHWPDEYAIMLCMQGCPEPPYACICDH